jgi:hypothetical protein
MSYWLDLFTGTTWREFIDAGSSVTGFRESTRARAKKVAPGDIFVCYLTGVKLWCGALEVAGPSADTRRVWKQDAFPVRFDVKPLVMLPPEHGIPMDELMGKVAFYQDASDRPGYKGFLRQSPAVFKRESDGELIFNLLLQAEVAPTPREVDLKLLERKPTYMTKTRVGGKTQEVPVSVPEPEEEADTTETKPSIVPITRADTRHTEMQWQLLALGSEMGLDVWVARNDRGRVWQGQTLGAMPRMLDSLPTQFNEQTNRTIELIDVLWLRGNSVQAAFEIEATTSIYSGLLRMSDLLALQPNLDIDLYLVAPDERREKVGQEILRPTFQLREKPLAKVCGFLSFSTLTEKIEGARQLELTRSLKPDFLREHAQFFGQIRAVESAQAG